MFSHRVDDQLELKLLEVRDAEDLYELTDESRLYLRDWLPWVDGTRTVEASRAFIQLTLQQFASNNGFQAGILFKGRLCGVIGFHAISWQNRTASIGYWLGERFQGQGIMTRACKAVVDIAFVEYGLNRVEIRAAMENDKSRAIPERLGFQEEGVCRDGEWLYNHFVDHAIYGILAKDWVAAQ